MAPNPTGTPQAAPDDGDHAPLSSAQRVMWLAEQVGTAGPSYHLHAVFDVDGRLRPSALRAALDAVVERHAVLRTTIVAADGVPGQRVHPPAPLGLTALDLTAEPAAGTSWTAHPTVAAFVDRRWDLAGEWPVRVATVALPGDRQGLVVVLHHIAADPAAVDVLFDELTALYAANVRGTAAELPPLACRYVDVARRQREWSATPAAEAGVERWREMLRDAPHLIALPLDRPRPALPDHRGGRTGLPIDAALGAGITRLAATYRTSVFTVMLAAYALALEAFGAGEDLLVATPSMRREDDTRGLIGCLVNLLPLRVRLSEATTFGELLRAVRAFVLAALEVGDVPFDTLLTALAVRRTPAAPPLAQVSIRMGTPPVGEYDLGDARLVRVTDDEVDSVKFDLSLAVESVGDSVTADLEYRRELFQHATVERFAASLVAILEQVVADPDGRVDALRTMPVRALRTVLDRWNPVPAPAELGGPHRPGTPVRAYVRDRYGRIAPVGVPGELFVGGAGDLPDPYAGTPDAVMTATGLTFRRTPGGQLEAVPPPAADPGAEPVSGPGSAHAGQPAAAGGPGTADGIRAIWQTLLRVEKVADGDDFFALGGDSLLAMRLMSRLRKAFQVRLALKDILAGPTFADQVRLVDERRSS